VSPSDAAPGAALVTGAGGFIGRHLTSRLLEQNPRVRALDLRLDGIAALDAPGLERLEGSVEDPATQDRALEGVEVVYHLAAAHLGASIEEAEFRRLNVDAVRELARRCAEAGVRRFVHCSSVGVYGRIERLPADEESPCRPRLAYEKTKLAGEEEVRDAVRRFGLSAVILRPAWVYGPGCPRTAKLFDAIERGRFAVAGSGRKQRHGVYIRDLVDAFVLAGTRRDLEGEVFVIGDESSASVRCWVDEIALLVGARPPRSLPTLAMTAAASAVELGFRAVGREPPLSRRTLEFFAGNTSFRTDRSRDRLGWAPRYDRVSGLAETQQYRQRGEFWRVPLGEPTHGGVAGAVPPQ
jgi:nucleoside-diphosphate-sugar epimerase